MNPMQAQAIRVVGVGALVVPSLAWAQEPPMAEPEPLPEPEEMSQPLPPPEQLTRETPALPPLPPSPPLAPPPSAEAVRARQPFRTEPGIHTHDGFYLRLGLGGGRGVETIERTAKDGSVATCEVESPAVVMDLTIGGTIGSGFVLGGSLYTAYVAPQLRGAVTMPESERENEHGATLSGLGLFAEWYPDPSGGFHVQGMLGGGTLLLSDTADSDYAPAGSLVSAGVGHSWWVGPDASLGILARADWASLAYEDDADVSFEHTWLHIGLMGTVTYH